MSKRITLPEATKRVQQRERRQMSRRIAAAEAARIDAARREIDNASQRIAVQIHNVNRDSVFSGIHAMLSAVAKSWGISNPIYLKRAWNSHLSAWTDFTNIHIQYPEDSSTWGNEVGSFNEGKLRLLISDIKGIGYHEIGHNRFTVPYPVLCDLVNADSEYRMMAYRKAWNVLEDVRMESAVVAESPQIAAYFTTMIYTWMLGSGRGFRDEIPAEQFVLLCGRRYIPRKVRDSLRAKFVAKYGEQLTQGIEACVRRYKAADTPEALFAEVIVLHDLLKNTNVDGSTVDRHDDPRRPRPKSSGDDERDKINKSKTEEQPEEQPIPTPDPDDSDDEVSDEQQQQQQSDSDRGEKFSDESDSADGGESAQDKDGNGDEADEADEAEEADTSAGTAGEQGDDAADTNDSASEGSGASNTGNDSQTLDKDYIRELLDEARQDILNEQSITDTIRDINERANTNTSSLSTAVERQPQQPQYEAKAEELALALVPTLSVFTAEKAPLWVSRQQHGVIDPFAYRTRPSGSNEYRRQYADEGNSGIDIAVTIMLDISTSMRGSEAGLGAAGFASKRACDVLEIPCTVTCFNHSGYLLWDKDDEPTHASLTCEGGTSPVELLNALDEQVYDCGTHVVLLMTDGVFELPNNTVGPYRSDDTDRWFVGLAYGNEANPELLRGMGFDFAQQISDLMQIPEILGSFLASFLR